MVVISFLPRIIDITNLSTSRNTNKQQKINISDVETCLHVLSTDNKDLKETYYYVLENYGLMAINRTTSILSCNKDRIINIEKYGLSKDVTISASISRRTIYEIEEIIKICKKYC